MQPDFDRFFAGYAAAYNRSLGDSVDVEAIQSSFAECFMAVGAEGVVCGKNDESFGETLTKGYAFYKSIGTKHLAVVRTEPAAIDHLHYVVKVAYRAEYQRKSAETVSIDFEVSYLLQTREGGLKIFAFVAGDEMALYRQHGLIED